MKKLELGDWIREKKPDVLCLTETKLESEFDANGFGWKDYNVLRKGREGMFGGGVTIMTDKMVNAKRIYFKNTKVEIVKEHVEMLYIVVMYMHRR